MVLSLSDVENMQLHGFADTSATAYACVIYLRILLKNGEIITSFISSKTKIAPIKKVCIPRLELMACVILINLMTVVKESMVDYVISNTFCWGDSTDCLFWIGRQDKVWCTFVQRRVERIREASPMTIWNHCPGKDNPADIPSRGLDLWSNDRLQKWLHGPTFMFQSRDYWPTQDKHLLTINCDKSPYESPEHNANIYNSHVNLINVKSGVDKFLI